MQADSLSSEQPGKPLRELGYKERIICCVSFLDRRNLTFLNADWRASFLLQKQKGKGTRAEVRELAIQGRMRRVEAGNVKS